ncbi:MAG: hypothetical protein HS111_15720 [Kofleriaceae bacterium]|nr:hypothetical protein [Kofleriaceae bacterium]
MSRLAACALVACALAARMRPRAAAASPRPRPPPTRPATPCACAPTLEATPGVRAASVLVTVPPVDPLAQQPGALPARVSIVVATSPAPTPR